MTYLDIRQEFFGHQETLSLLKRRVIDLKEGYRQNIAILGNRFIGKSVLLQYFLLNLDDEDVIDVYLDLENKNLDYVFSKFIGSLLYNFAKTKNLPLHDDINVLLEATKKDIPETVEVIKRIRRDLQQGKASRAYLGLLTLPEIFTNESKKYCLLVIDEFQHLEGMEIADAFQVLGKKIMTQKRCLYIVASSYPAQAKRIIAEKLSLLFGNFEMLQIEPLDSSCSQLLIDRRLVSKKIGAQLRVFLADFCGGHPLYLNLICRELINLSAIHNQDEIYMPLLAQAVENTIFDRWGVLSRHFELIINDIQNTKGHQQVPSILMAIANGHHKIDDIVTMLESKRTYVRQKVNMLLEAGVIVKNGNFHYFKDKLFKYWIKFVYQKRLKDVELAPDKQRRQFRDEFNRAMDDFKLVARKNFATRIADLLGCFSDESFELNGRRYKMPSFKEVIPFKIRNDNGHFMDIIKASTGTDTWFLVLKKDNLVEADITTFLKESKKIGHKPQRSLIISLGQMEDNVKLKALQERIWVWSEQEVNVLLNLFDQPFIVR